MAAVSSARFSRIGVFVSSFAESAVVVVVVVVVVVSLLLRTCCVVKSCAKFDDDALFSWNLRSVKMKLAVSLDGMNVSVTRENSWHGMYRETCRWGPKSRSVLMERFDGTF